MFEVKKKNYLMIKRSVRVRHITGVLSGSRVPSTIPLSGGSSVIISFLFFLSERESANNASRLYSAPKIESEIKQRTRGEGRAVYLNSLY